MRVRFSDVFNVNPNGMYSPKMVVRIGGATFTPGAAFGAGVSFSGVSVASFAGKDLEVKQHPDGVVELLGTY